MKTIMTAATLAALFLTASCSKEAPAPQVDAPDAFVPEKPAGTAIAIPEARNTLSPGDDIVIAARVMGTKTPFVDTRAVFVVGDEGTLTACNEIHGDGCPTPWDTCCDSPEAKRIGTATVQLLGADGNVLPLGLKGLNGLKELSRVVVAGTVAPNSSPEAFIVNANEIYVGSE